MTTATVSDITVTSATSGGTNHWLCASKGATNEKGFAALPGGYSYFEG